MSVSPSVRSDPDTGQSSRRPATKPLARRTPAEAEGLRSDRSVAVFIGLVLAIGVLVMAAFLYVIMGGIAL